MQVSWQRTLATCGLVLAVTAHLIYCHYTAHTPESVLSKVPSVAMKVENDNHGEESNNNSIAPSTHRRKDKLERIGQIHHCQNASALSLIDRIFYINLHKNPGRRAFMEGWLCNQSIPFERFEAVMGSPFTTGGNSSCVAGKTSPPKCKKISGLVQSNLGLLDLRLNSTAMGRAGHTLVLEDDYVILDMSRLEASIELVPDDWDVIRWNCWGDSIPKMKHTLRNSSVLVFRTAPTEKCPQNGKCWFCGGTHATLWRNSTTALTKLRGVWSSLPYEDIDCQLTTNKLKSYCINMKHLGMFHRPKGEEKSIPHGK